MVGAVYTPAEVMVPLVAVQFTAELYEPVPTTVAVKVWVAPVFRVAVVGETDTPVMVEGTCTVTVAVAFLAVFWALVAVIV